MKTSVNTLLKVHEELSEIRRDISSITTDDREDKAVLANAQGVIRMMLMRKLGEG